ncbi:MAG: tetratricopeptide repeat protein [Planctomycetota bacterium]
MNEERRHEAERITKRIQSVTLARSLALAGRYDRAIELLEQARGLYADDPALLEKLDWMLRDYREKSG